MASIIATVAAISVTFLFVLTSSQGLSDSENKTHIHFYFHDVFVASASAGNKSILEVVQPLNGSSTAFGMTIVTDDPLTEKEDPTSMEVGRAQGIYISSSQRDVSLLMLMNLVFTGGEHKGSSLSMMGRNKVLDDVREMPVVGGTGKFRLARGYALAHSINIDTTTGNAVVEYNVYVMH